jgi:hypothetical protein
VTILVIAALALGAGVYLVRSSDPEATAAAQAVVPPQNLKPHTASTPLPELFDIPPDYAPRPPDVIRAAYKFAAEHPEVLSYVPCFCGCEAAGHQGNHDCFVRQRAENGDVVAWDEHGVECAVCIDVATRARQLHAEGKSVVDIRSEIEKSYAGRATNKTPTPHPH